MTKIYKLKQAIKRRRRAIELVSIENNFRTKIIKSKKVYKRQQRNQTDIHD